VKKGEQKQGDQKVSKKSHSKRQFFVEIDGEDANKQAYNYLPSADFNSGLLERVEVHDVVLGEECVRVTHLCQISEADVDLVRKTDLSVGHDLKVFMRETPASKITRWVFGDKAHRMTA
jgi:hypothetical protein